MSYTNFIQSTEKFTSTSVIPPPRNPYEYTRMQKTPPPEDPEERKKFDFYRRTRDQIENRLLNEPCYGDEKNDSQIECALNASWLYDKEVQVVHRDDINKGCSIIWWKFMHWTPGSNFSRNHYLDYNGDIHYDDDDDIPIGRIPGNWLYARTRTKQLFDIVYNTHLGPFKLPDLADWSKADINPSRVHPTCENTEQTHSSNIETIPVSFADDKEKNAIIDYISDEIGIDKDRLHIPDSDETNIDEKYINEKYIEATLYLLPDKDNNPIEENLKNEIEKLSGGRTSHGLLFEKRDRPTVTSTSLVSQKIRSGAYAASDVTSDPKSKKLSGGAIGGIVGGIVGGIILIILIIKYRNE